MFYRLQNGINKKLKKQKNSTKNSKWNELQKISFILNSKSIQKFCLNSKRNYLRIPKKFSFLEIINVWKKKKTIWFCLDSADWTQFVVIYKKHFFKKKKTNKIVCCVCLFNKYYVFKKVTFSILFYFPPHISLFWGSFEASFCFLL